MLGLVSVQNMQTNLLPNVNTPYLMVVTVYPGASPERVENEDVYKRQITSPGSDTQGIPASLHRAQFSPSSLRRRIPSPFCRACS